MNEAKKLLVPVGNALAVIGTATQTNEVLQIVSTVITIVGGIVTLIVIPLLNWYQRAKKDGKITVSEIKDGIEIVNDGIDKIKKANVEESEEEEK